MTTDFRILQTPLGHAAIVTTRRGLRRVYTPQRSLESLRRSIRREFPDATENPRLAPDTANALRRYFNGQPVTFDTKNIDWAHAGDFRRAVWKACSRIPYGQTVSYAELAELAGKPGAARAVGTAMRTNPLPIIVPCHRVLRSDGSLGGYSAPDGVRLKRRLLDLEAANAL